MQKYTNAKNHPKHHEMTMGTTPEDSKNHPRPRTEGPRRAPCLLIFLYFIAKRHAKNRHSRSAAALKPAWGAGFNAAALREWRFFDSGRNLEIVN